MIDPKKQYRTRDGRDVRIYAVDGGDEFCVHGAILIGGIWCQRSWPIGGIIGFTCKSDADLIEVKPRIKREVWVNVYPDDVGAPCNSKDEADQVWRLSGRIACVKLVIDCEEGHGLD